MNENSENEYSSINSNGEAENKQAKGPYPQKKPDYVQVHADNTCPSCGRTVFVRQMDRSQISKCKS